MPNSTAFQYIFDNAETISIDRRAVTAQTISRDNTVRTVSRGGQVWRFTVKLPDGISWQTLRPYIEAIDNADRYTRANVQLNNTGYTTWLSAYQGQSSNTSAWTANVTQGNTSMTLTSVSGLSSSQYTFKAGDFVQLGTSGNVYSIVQNVVYPTTTVQLNRAVIDTTGSKTLVIGPNVIWQVYCTQLPSWTIFARDQVSWDGEFVFYEALT